MTLHCASRLGVLSYLYEKRHSVAFKIGLIAEVPIAMCNREYDFGKGLVIHDNDSGDSTIPPAIFHAQEIQLFITSIPQLELKTDWLAINSSRQLFPDSSRYSSPSLSIFHPPS